MCSDRRPAPPSADAGFSLLEVLVAFAVTGLVLAALLPGLQMSRTRAHMANERRQAVQFAQSQIEALKLLPASAPSVQTGYSHPWSWTANLSLQPAPDSAALRLRTIRLEVGLRDASAPLLTIETRQIIQAAVE